MRLRIPLTTFAVVLVCLGAAQAEYTYDVIDLGEGIPTSINDHGQVVGDVDWRAVMFDTTGAGNHIQLGTIMWASTSRHRGSANSINNSGQIVGYERRDQVAYATLFDPTGQGDNIDLGSPDSEHSEAFCINDSGQILGLETYEQAGLVMTLLDATGAGNSTPLPPFDASNVRLWRMNNSGQAVGWYSTADNPNSLRAILYDPAGLGGYVDLDPNPGRSGSAAAGINNLGQIVGRATHPPDNTRATLFDPTGGGDNVNLGVLGDWSNYSETTAINDRGEIVGWTMDRARRQHIPTIFTPDGPVDLNSLIDPSSYLTLTHASDINNNGWIIGLAEDPFSNLHAFLLKPVPEPGTLLLLGLGAVCLRRRRPPQPL